MTVFLLATDRPFPRLGVAATRKLGGAVVRNRAKRLAREVFRRHKPATGHDVVIVPRREMLDASFSNLESDFADILRRPIRPGRPGGSADARRPRRPRSPARV
jgi:ribonuclease P protein component